MDEEFLEKQDIRAMITTGGAQGAEKRLEGILAGLQISSRRRAVRHGDQWRPGNSMCGQGDWNAKPQTETHIVCLLGVGLSSFPLC